MELTGASGMPGSTKEFALTVMLRCIVICAGSTAGQWQWSTVESEVGSLAGSELWECEQHE
jgi:hypothetical protein